MNEHKSIEQLQYCEIIHCCSVIKYIIVEYRRIHANILPSSEQAEKLLLDAATKHGYADNKVINFF